MILLPRTVATRIGIYMMSHFPDQYRTQIIYDRICHICSSNAICHTLKPTGHVMHHHFNIQQLYALPTLYLCVLYLSENKQRLVPHTAQTGWFL
jgi:hypothetical protein